MDLLYDLLASFGGGAAVALALSGWLGKVWADRILANTTSQHQKELEGIKNELAIQLERAKWPMTREDARAAAFRDALEAFLLPSLSAAHSICWFTWFAVKAPAEFDKEKLLQYEGEMHGFLPRVSSALTLLSAHDAEAFELLKERAHTLYDLDQKTAIAARSFFIARDEGKDTSDSLSNLSKYLAESGELEWAIPNQVAGFVQRIEERRSRAVRARTHRQ